MRAVRALLGAALILVAATGCVSQAGLPEDCQAAAVQREVALAGDRLDPESISVCKGQELSLMITSQRAGEIHLHGYEDEVAVEPGVTAILKFSAIVAGQFPIELHPPNEEPEIEVGILTVNEP